MMTRFGVKNYKCLADVSIPLTPIHVLIGQNDAGKTSLLEAMNALYLSSKVSLAHVFPKKWEGRELVFEHAEKPEIELQGCWKVATPSRVREIEYGFRVEFPGREKVCKLAVEWLDDCGRTELPVTVNDLTRLAYPMHSPSDISSALDSLRGVMASAQLYRLNPKMMSLPAAYSSVRRVRMDPDGFGLSTLLDDILGFDPEQFLQLRKRFCHLYPQFRNLRIETEEAAARDYRETGIDVLGQATGKAIYLETRGGTRIRAQQASDGAILMLGLLALTFSQDPPTLLLLEEPENGIYPKRLEEVISILKDFAGDNATLFNPQIVISTHSPYVISFFTPDEVTFMSRQPDGSVRARPLRDAPNIKERLAEDFYLGELWYNLTEEELFGDAPRETAHA